MCHLDSMRLHRMLIAVVIVANLWVIEVCYLNRVAKSGINTVRSIGACCCYLGCRQKHWYRISQHAGYISQRHIWQVGRQAGSVDQKCSSTFRDLPMVPQLFCLLLSGREVQAWLSVDAAVSRQVKACLCLLKQIPRLSLNATRYRKSRDHSAYACG